MKLGCQKRIISIVLSLALFLNLILIPKINAQAATYPATTSFTYNFQGYDYQFYFSGEVSSPQDFKFDSSTLDYLINKASEGLNLSISSGLGAKIDWVSGIVLNSVFDFYRNFVVATDKVIADWIVWSDIYGFTYTFSGVDSDYPGHETYGDAYGWRFTGWLGEKIDLVLDSQGMLYGSNPIGNYTFSEDQQEFGTWSIHQHDGDDIWMPSVSTSSFNDLKQPYIDGKTLYFWLYANGNEIACNVPDFTKTVISFMSPNGDYWYGLFCFKTNGQNVTLNVGNSSFTSPYKNYTMSINYSGAHGPAYVSNFIQLQSADMPIGTSNQYAINYPSYIGYGTSGNYYLVRSNNCLGFYNGQKVPGVGDIWLDSLSTTPLPDPIVLPVDDPLPVSNIDPDPIVFDPDPGDDPDPVPGIDYPVPGPTPIPVPPLPPLVSGNDDLWPDMNGVFQAESEIDGFLGNLSNFEFTPLRTLVEGFASSLMWVSTIMMALYNGSDFSILFVVLSIFFIAAALLGIYKWWTH